MTLEDLAIARDWAVIILAIQVLVVVVVALFVAYQANRAMRRARPKAATGLHRARHVVVDASQVVRRRVVDVARPVVWVDSAGVGVRAAWAAWRRGRTPFVRNLIRRR